MFDRAGAGGNRLRGCEAPSPGVISELLADETEDVRRSIVREIRGLSGRSG